MAAAAPQKQPRAVTSVQHPHAALLQEQHRVARLQATDPASPLPTQGPVAVPLQGQTGASSIPVERLPRRQEAEVEAESQVTMQSRLSGSRLRNSVYRKGQGAESGQVASPTESREVAAPEATKPPGFFSKSPKLVDVVPGQSYLWCTCGRSKTHPFCDSSHIGTGMLPKRFTPTKPKVLLCQCKATCDPPYCDGSHARVPDW